MPHKLQLLIERKGDLLCVEVDGQLDSETSHQLAKVTDIAITDTTRSVRAVILDCKGMNYVSGLGWHSVLSLGRSLHGCDVKLMLIDLQPQLRVIFENSNYRGLLSVHRTKAGALGALS